MSESNKYASPEQLRYAKVLGLGVQSGFVLLVISFILYMAGVLKPLIPVSQLPKYWGLPAAQFVKATHTPVGWGWLSDIGMGDELNMIGIAVLASVSAISTFAVLPFFARRGEKAHMAIAVLLIGVLLLSASNLLPR
jgi:hypothetical protein